MKFTDVEKKPPKPLILLFFCIFAEIFAAVFFAACRLLKQTIAKAGEKHKNNKSLLIHLLTTTCLFIQVSHVRKRGKISA